MITEIICNENEVSFFADGEYQVVYRDYLKHPAAGQERAIVALIEYICELTNETIR